MSFISGTSKKEQKEFKNLHVFTNEEKLKMVVDAHNDGFCREFFGGMCHLCNDRYCVLCKDLRPNSVSYPCSQCYIRLSIFTIIKLTKQLETCEDKCTSLFCCNCKDCICQTIMHLQCSIMEHDKGICSCPYEYHN